MRNNKNKKAWHHKIISFTLWSMFLVGLGFFIHKRWINSINDAYMKKVSGLCKKMVVKRDISWYEKQKKYSGGSNIESVTFTSRRNSDEVHKSIVRPGFLMLNENAPATVLICHGFMTSKDDMGIMRFIFNGYNVMTFDFRAHGEEIDNQCCTFGCDEMYDVIAAAEFLKAHPKLRGKPLIVYGFSMGAVASIMAQRARPDLFDCAIWDCPFDSTEGLIGRSIDKMKLSLFGYDFALPGKSFFKKYAYHPYIQEFLKAALKSISSMDATQINTRIQPLSPKDAAKEITIPVFLIACHNDEKAPPTAVLDIYKNIASSYKRCWIASGRRHFDALFANPEKYIYKVHSFIKTCLSGECKNKKSEKIKEDPWTYQMLFTLQK